MVSDLKTFAHKGCKIAVAKKVFTDFFSICVPRLDVFLPPLPEVGCPIFLEIRNPWGKVMEGSGLTFEHLVWKCSKIAKLKIIVFIESAHWADSI